MKEALHGCTIGFVGGGAMAEAIIAGLLRAGIAPEAIFVGEVRSERRKALEQSYRVRTTEDNAAVAAASDVLLIAVKPQQIAKALAPLFGVCKPDATVVSVAAGISTAKLRGWLGEKVAIVRAMPNTPALIGEGITALYSDADAGHRARAEAVLGACGEVVWIEDEEEMHAITAISGSGPAYLFLLAELMMRAGERLGLDAALADRLVRRTLLGAARLLVVRDEAPSALRAQVTSPGGTTEAALGVLFDRGLPEAMREAIAAAAARSRELGER